MTYRQYLTNSIGIFEITADDQAVSSINYVSDIKESNPNVITENACRELQEYFDGKLTTFTMPFKYHSTPFREMVWNELITIPYGETRSYGDIAKAIGKPKASRAVGQAVHFNPIMIVVPCHRVIGSNKQMVGFACGIDVKVKLLDLENSHRQ